MAKECHQLACGKPAKENCDICGSSRCGNHITPKMAGDETAKVCLFCMLKGSQLLPAIRLREHDHTLANHGETILVGWSYDWIQKSLAFEACTELGAYEELERGFIDSLGIFHKKGGGY